MDSQESRAKIEECFEAMGVTAGVMAHTPSMALPYITSSIWRLAEVAKYQEDRIELLKRALQGDERAAAELEASS